MIKKLLILLLVMQMPMVLTHCTSKDSKEDGDEAAVEGSSTDGEESADSEEAATEEEGTEETADAEAEGDGEEQATEEKADATEEVADAPTADAPPASTSVPEPTKEKPAEPPTETIASVPEPTSGEVAPTEPPPADAPSTMGSGLTEEAPKPQASLKKIVTAPYKAAGTTVNAVYLARQGDTLASISQKIYGSDKTAELKKINTWAAGRSVKVGDKIYHNSPQRPTDMEKMLNFYEDKGVAPEIYTAKAGDNIRTVSSTLLGDANSWKEVWATNLDVESKAELAEGTQLKYWKGDVPAAPAPTTVASTGINEAPPPVEMPPPPAEMPVAQNTMPEAPQELAPPPPPPVEMPPPVEAAPPPPPPVAEAPPPPPPMEEAPPPPPPAEADANAEEGFAEEGGGMGNDLIMQIGAGAVLLLAGVGFIVMRRRKQQAAMENAYMDTNVGT